MVWNSRLQDAKSFVIAAENSGLICMWRNRTAWSEFSILKRSPSSGGMKIQIFSMQKQVENMPAEYLLMWKHRLSQGFQQWNRSWGAVSAGLCCGKKNQVMLKEVGASQALSGQIHRHAMQNQAEIKVTSFHCRGDHWTWRGQEGTGNYFRDTNWSSSQTGWPKETTVW